jgi:DNA-binding MarR family transcriptional regulator
MNEPWAHEGEMSVAADAAGPASGPLAPDACVLRHVARVSRAVVAAYDPALAPFGLTGHQFNLMMTLRQSGALTVGALAATLGMDASGVPRAIKPLAQAGLVQVERGADRRQRMLSLTPAGLDRLNRAEPAWASVQAELVGQIGGEAWSALMGELRLLRRAATGCSTRAA